VLAADTDVWSTPDGRVRAAGAGVDAQGRPVPGSVLGNWALVSPDGKVSAGLGPDLLPILGRGSLLPGLPDGMRPSQATGGEDLRRPARDIQWGEPPPSGTGTAQVMDRGQGEAAGPVAGEKRKRSPEEQGPEPSKRRHAVTHSLVPQFNPLPPARPEPGTSASRRYLKTSQVEFAPRVTYAQAEDLLDAVVTEAVSATHPAATTTVQPGNIDKIDRALSLLSGLFGPAYHLNAQLSDAELGRYRQGAQITTEGLTVAALDQLHLSGSQNARFVILPLAGRSGRYASQGRDASLLLGAGKAVFPPGTTLTVHERHDVSDHGGRPWSTTIVLAETPAAVRAPLTLEDVIPVTGPGALGLNESLHRYLYQRAVEAELNSWSAIEPDEQEDHASTLMQSLLTAANARLAAIGVPEVTYGTGTVDSADIASFAQSSWEMTIESVPEEWDDVLFAASTIWHEARHAEHAFLALRYLASESPELLTAAYTTVEVPHVLDQARDNGSAPGSPEHEAGKYWASLYFGAGTEEYAAIDIRKTALFKAYEKSQREFRRAERSGAEKAQVDKLRQAADAAEEEYVQHGYRPQMNRPEEWEANGTQSLVWPVTVESLPMPPGVAGEQPVFYRRIGAVKQDLVRLGLGVETGQTADLLLSPMDDIAVVHGLGKDGLLSIGGVAVGAGWIQKQLSELADSSWEVVLLASDSEKIAQELADARNTRVWAPPPRAAGQVPLADVWVSLGTGAVAVGLGELTGDGKLQITTAPLHSYEPAGRRGTVAAQGQPGFPPVRTLTEAQALSDRGPWQRRTAQRPVGPLDWEDMATDPDIPPHDLGPAIPPLPLGTSLGDGPWQPRTR
jgi:hypothetical protein